VSQEVKFKKGDMLVKEGEMPKSFYVVQSGKVSLFIERGGQKVEIDQIGPGQIVAEQGIFGFPKSAFNCEALSEVKAVAIPVEPIKTVFDKTPAAYKVFVKALGEDIRRARNTMRGLKMDQDNSPCPPRFIPRLCAIVTLVAKNSGTKPKVDANVPVYKRDEEKAKNPHFKDEDLILSFNTLKIYTSRMFLESHQRMQNFCELLGKLKYATLRYEKNEDTEQLELQEVRFHDLMTVEHFGEFYQHNLFKAGKSEMIHLDAMAYQLAGAFSALAVDGEVDRQGIVKLNYQQFIKDLKEKFHLELKDTHLNILEKKGLFVKRSTLNEVVFFQFDRFEFTQTYKFWQIINEIDRWNEKGFVDVNADYNKIEQKAGSGKCPSCQGELKESVNFCPNCGHKLAAAA
jgi:hypothetical protein